VQVQVQVQVFNVETDFFFLARLGLGIFCLQEWIQNMLPSIQK